MNIAELKKIVKREESQVLEFKKSTAELKTAMQTVCAFLNSDVGGTVLIGITDDGKIIGQEISDNTRKAIGLELNKIEPHISENVEYISINGGKCYIVAIVIHPGKKAPYMYDGRAYIRSQSTTRRMSQEEYENLLQSRRSTVAWDTLTTNDCTINDLDKNRIRQVVRLAIAEGRLSEIAAKASINELLKKFDLMVDERLTNAAVVLFCKNEKKQFIQSELKIARFRGVTRSEFIDNRNWRGNIFDLYEHAMKTLLFYLPVAAKIEEGNPFRVETPAIPNKVLREALINAFCHRDYNMNGSISVAAYDDRIEIISPGRLPQGIKLSELTKLHESHPRNNLIASVLYDCRMIEKWGRGTLDMIKYCKQSGNPIPKYEETSGNFWVTLLLKESMPRLLRTPAIQLTDRQEEILKILKQRPMSREQIMELMQAPPTPRTIQMDLSSLKKLQLINSSGKARSIVWIITKK